MNVAPLAKLRDADIRRAVIARIQESHTFGSYVLKPEIATLESRVDLLLVDDRITGIEIKSDVDSLARLPKQIEGYGALCERAVLVAAPRHFTAASAMVSPWWGLWAARRTADGHTALRVVRRGRLNPAFPAIAVALMPRSAVIAALTELGETRLSRRGIYELRELLIARAGERRALAAARAAMLQRQDWHRGSLYGGPCDRGPHTESDTYRDGDRWIRYCTRCGLQWANERGPQAEPMIDRVPGHAPPTTLGSEAATVIGSKGTIIGEREARAWVSTTT